MNDGTKFDNPVELVQYHTHHVDGLLTTLQVPCCRSHGQPPQGYRFITHDEMQAAMREAALQLGYKVRAWQGVWVECVVDGLGCSWSDSNAVGVAGCVY